MAMKPKHRRLVMAGIGLAFLGAAVAVVLAAFKENIVFFLSPSEILSQEIDPDRRLRVGGLVEEGSISRGPDGVTVLFRVTDTVNTVPVSYRGLLPDLFREGQGVVTEGHFRNGVFVASEVLAKHDENYMPPEVADALKKSGQWQHFSSDDEEEDGNQDGQADAGGQQKDPY